MSRHAYRVVVNREDGQWLADVPELPGMHTSACRTKLCGGHG
jgi:predicted RNase H-like HicB family nuclease